MPWSLSITLLAASLLAGGTATADDAIDGAHAAELRRLLVQDCGSCHGLRLRGGLGPALDPGRLAALSMEALVTVILDGRPGTAMPAWRGLLDRREALWLVERLKEGTE